MMDFTQVKEVVIPEGEAKQIAQLASNVSFDSSFDSSFQTGEKVILWLKSAPPPEEVKAIKFSSELPNSISLKKSVNTMSVNMEYSYDGIDWTVWDFTALPFGGENGDLYIRGDNTSLAVDSSRYCYFQEGTGQTDYTVSGNIMYLLSHDGSRQLGDYAFYSLFVGCSHMTSAPELPANTLTWRCYYSLFNNCTRLTEIKCLATNISASESRSNWVRNVSSEGTFYKSKDATWPSGSSGIPSGWTIIDVGDQNQAPSRGGLLQTPRPYSSVITLTASEGHYLTQVDDNISDLDRWITKEIYLGNTDSEENYKEITEGEGNAILAILQLAFESSQIEID